VKGDPKLHPVGLSQFVHDGFVVGKAIQKVGDQILDLSGRPAADLEEPGAEFGGRAPRATAVPSSVARCRSAAQQGRHGFGVEVCAVHGETDAYFVDGAAHREYGHAREDTACLASRSR
jgi:hypothetical protein